MSIGIGPFRPFLFEPESIILFFFTVTGKVNNGCNLKVFRIYYIILWVDFIGHVFSLN